MSEVHAHLVDDPNKLARMSQALEAVLARSPADSPTMHPDWLLTWWSVFGHEDGRALRVLVVEREGKVCGFVPLLSRTVREHLTPVRRLELVGSGEAEADEIDSHYLAVVAARGDEEVVAEALADALVRGTLGPWDDIALERMRADTATPTFLESALRRRGFVVSSRAAGVAPFIRLPSSWDDYLATLSSQSRAWLRRTLRDFEAWADGTAQFHRAQNAADIEPAQHILHTLHRERWGQAGREGVFASAKFRRFHDQLIQQWLARGLVDLTWVTVHGRPVGVHYSIIRSGAVQFYQSGRAMDLPARVRIGIVMHAHAIRAAIDAGRREYDFLPSPTRYKRQLAHDARPVVSLRAARPTLRAAARQTVDLAVEHARALKITMAARPRRGARGGSIAG
jgi:CelD/BcsL family acetyltransferase involved in cellulose biosynthesis